MIELINVMLSTIWIWTWTLLQCVNALRCGGLTALLHGKPGQVMLDICPACQRALNATWGEIIDSIIDSIQSAQTHMVARVDYVMVNNPLL